MIEWKRTIVATVLALAASRVAVAWIPSSPLRPPFISLGGTTTVLASSDEDSASDEGQGLAAEFFKLAQQKGIGLDAEDLLDDEEDDEDEEDEEEDEDVPNIPQGAVNAFLGYDTGNMGDKLAGNVSLTNDQLYSEVKERVLDTAGGFVEYVKGARDEDDDDDDDDDFADAAPKPYKPPETVPNAEFTAGEVVLQVLESLRHNNVPTVDKGVEILFGFSSPTSQIQTEVGLTPAEYRAFLQENAEYKVLLDPLYNQVSIEKADYSPNGQKAFFTARLMKERLSDSVNVNFILSSCKPPADPTAPIAFPTAAEEGTGDSAGGKDSDSCWLIDSILIRPESMRRRRRR